MLLQLLLELFKLDSAASILIELSEYELALFLSDILVESPQQSKELRFVEGAGLRILKLVEQLF